MLTRLAAGGSTIFAYGPTTSGLSLNVIVPGGQQTFVRADGSLGYTIAHSAAIPDGALSTPFQYTPQVEQGRVGQLLFDNKGFNACPVAGEAGVYQIYARAVPSVSSCTLCSSYMDEGEMLTWCRISKPLSVLTSPLALLSRTVPPHGNSTKGLSSIN